MVATWSGRLRLPDQVRLAILNHGRACAPDECCGLLALDRHGAIRFAYPTTNVSPSPVTFTIDPVEHFHAANHAESNGWDVRGVFHSHPRGPARPSMVDLRISPGRAWIHLITDLDEVHGFQLVDGTVLEIPLEPGA